MIARMLLNLWNHSLETTEMNRIGLKAEYLSMIGWLLHQNTELIKCLYHFEMSRDDLRLLLGSPLLSSEVGGLLTSILSSPTGNALTSLLFHRAFEATLVYLKYHHKDDYSLRVSRLADMLSTLLREGGLYHVTVFIHCLKISALISYLSSFLTLI